MSPALAKRLAELRGLDNLAAVKVLKVDKSGARAVLLIVPHGAESPHVVDLDLDELIARHRDFFADPRDGGAGWSSQMPGPMLWVVDVSAPGFVGEEQSPPLQ